MAASSATACILKLGCYGVVELVNGDIFTNIPSGQIFMAISINYI